MPVYRVRGLFPSASRHDLPWQARGWGADRARAGVLGGGLGHSCHRAGLRGQPPYGLTLVGRGRRAAPRLFVRLSVRGARPADPTRRVVCGAQRRQGWGEARSRGAPPSLALAAWGVDSDRPHDEAPAGDRCWPAHPSHGPARGASGGAGASARLGAALPDRRLPGVRDRTADALRPLGAPLRHQAKGPVLKPRWMPLPQLRYAQVVKTMRRGVWST